MPTDFDPEEFRPDDLKLERLWDRDPEFRRLWVERCKAERAFRQAENSETAPREYVPVVERVNKARQLLNEYLNTKGLVHLSVWQGKRTTRDLTGRPT